MGLPGLGGAIFDWLRMLYRRITYHGRHGDVQSAEFKAFIGLLTGDPASPILWNLFLSVLVMMPDKDDISLAAILLSISPFLPVFSK
jgi:hypothetical protein